MARACRRGSTAWEAAGKVHTEIQQAFVRAEVVAWEDLVEAGGYAAARDRGLLRTEGRDYVVADGDVSHQGLSRCRAAESAPRGRAARRRASRR